MGTDMREMGQGQLAHANIVVTCTKKKRRPPDESLKVRDIAKDSIEEGFEIWSQRIMESGEVLMPPRDLYAGDHWNVAVSLEKVAEASGFKAIIWVCSAGYGLLNIDRMIRPYSATFSSSHPDTVCKWGKGTYSSSYREMWWRLLTELPGPDPGTPRSIASLALRDPTYPLIVVASRDYMDGIKSDCKEARNELVDPDLLSIVSAGSHDLPGLDSNLLPADVSLRQLLGGTVRALNIRYTRKILSEVRYEQLRASLLHQECSRILAQAPSSPAIQRTRTSDQDVREFIWSFLKQHGKTSRTTLLHSLRESGFACSQNRFERVFDATADSYFRTDSQGGRT